MLSPRYPYGFLSALGRLISLFRRRWYSNTEAVGSNDDDLKLTDDHDD